MSALYNSLSRKRAYWDQDSASSPEEWFTALTDSTTLYLGNLSFYLTEEQVYEIFAPFGTITRLVVGLNRQKREPCGFCFIKFSTHEEASYAHTIANGGLLFNQVFRCDWDTGAHITEKRKFGRGSHGGQVRDSIRDGAPMHNTRQPNDRDFASYSKEDNGTPSLDQLSWGNLSDDYAAC